MNYFYLLCGIYIFTATTTWSYLLSGKKWLGLVAAISSTVSSLYFLVYMYMFQQFVDNNFSLVAQYLTSIFQHMGIGS